MNIKSGSALAGALLLGSLWVSGGVAGAQEYSGLCSISASGVVTPGGTISVTGSGFEPNITSPLLFTDADSTDQIGTVTTNDAGNFGPQNFTLPATITGNSATLSSVCDSGDPGDPAATVLGVTLERTATTVANGALPRTGDSSTEPLAAVGIGAIALGAGAVVVARRRRTTSA